MLYLVLFAALIASTAALSWLEKKKGPAAKFASFIMSCTAMLAFGVLVSMVMPQSCTSSNECHQDWDSKGTYVNCR